MAQPKPPVGTLLPTSIASGATVFLLDLATHGRIPAAATLIAALLLATALIACLLSRLLVRR